MGDRMIILKISGNKNMNFTDSQKKDEGGILPQSSFS
jgi:hypothetical protein